MLFSSQESNALLCQLPSVVAVVVMATLLMLDVTADTWPSSPSSLQKALSLLLMRSSSATPCSMEELSSGIR